MEKSKKDATLESVGISNNQQAILDSKRQKLLANQTKAGIAAERKRLESLQPPSIDSAHNPIIGELLLSVKFSPLIDSNDIQILKKKETVINFLKIINRRKIEIAMLRSLSFRGIPSEIKGLRPIIWKVLIGYLPRETSKWLSMMQENKKIYDGLKEDLIVIPDLDNPENNNKHYDNDHPLSVKPKSLWNQYFVDNVVWTEIEKDVRRTRNDMQFFTDAFDESNRHLKD